MKKFVALVLVTLCARTSADANEKGMRKRNPILVQDARLQATVNVDGMNRKIKDLLAVLEGATKTRIALDDNLQAHSPEYGSFQLGTTRASVVMDILEVHQLENGRWIKDGDGYLLTGKSVMSKRAVQTDHVESDRPAPHRPFPWLPVIGGVTALTTVTVCGVVLVRRRRSKSAESSAEPVAKTPTASKKEPK